MGIKARMVLTVSAVYLLFGVSISLLTLRQYGAAYRDSVADNLTLLTTTLADDIDGRLAFARQALAAVAANFSPELLLSPATSQNYLDQRVTLQSIFKRGIQLIDAQGRLIAAYPPSTNQIGSDLSSRQYVAATRADGLSHFYKQTGNEGGGRFNVIVTFPITDAQGNMVAMLAGTVDLLAHSLQTSQSTNRIGASGRFVIIDRKHEVLYRLTTQSGAAGSTLPLPSQSKATLSLIETAVQRGTATGESVVAGSGEAVIEAFRPLHNSDWLVGVYYLSDDAYALLDQAQQKLFIYMITGFALLLIIAIAIAERFAAPLTRMAAHMRRLPQLPPEQQPLQLYRRDEIGTLAHAFDEMIQVTHEQKEALQGSIERAEAEQAKSEAIVAAIGEGICILDRDFRVVYQNQLHRNMVGEHPGHYCYQAFECSDEVCQDCPVSAAFADGAVHTAERMVGNGTNRATIEITASPLRNSSGEIVAGIEAVRDISERKRNERRIRELNHTLEERATTLEQLYREQQAFSYSLSHDIKTPLSTIYASAQMLRDDYAERLDDNGRFLLEAIALGSERLDEIIDAMLQLAQISKEEMQCREINLSSMAHEVGIILQAGTLERSAEFVIADNITATGDPRLLRSVLENLLGNAWKYTGKTQGARIEFGRLHNPGENVYFVRDNGAGFDMALSKKLFQPFKRLHSETEFSGVGIGLATVAKIIERHNGRIWAESAPGQGATFFFTLG